MEWLQGECQSFFWETARRQRVHWCSSVLWGWSAYGGSQRHRGLFKSIFWENAPEEHSPPLIYLEGFQNPKARHTQLSVYNVLVLNATIFKSKSFPCNIGQMSTLQSHLKRSLSMHEWVSYMANRWSDLGPTRKYYNSMHEVAVWVICLVNSLSSTMLIILKQGENLFMRYKSGNRLRSV